MLNSLRDLRPHHVAAAICAALLLIVATHARAAPGPLMRAGDAESGMLLLRTEEPGKFLPAPTVATDVEITVSGVVARTTVRQRFHNPTDQWVEGVYVFPLPERGAVDTLRMQIGDRFIEGRIEERQKARQQYEQAMREGKRASLLEQERPNLFTNSVANIGPDETVVVEIHYQERLVPDDGRFAVRFPMVVAPRYIPGSTDIHTVGATGTGLVLNTDRVPDADRITPPVPRPENAPENQVTVRVVLAPGMPAHGVESPYHPVAIDAADPDRLAITLVEGETIANRDFVLRWRVGDQTAPVATTLTESTEQGRFALVLVTPPVAPVPETALPREVVFVIDTSGSMSGGSMDQAKAALQVAMTDLGPDDRFNLISFNNEPTALFADARPVNQRTLDLAARFIAGLDAEGGTEMAKALLLALPRGQATDRLRQVVFITDGAVGNETELFELVETRRQASRVFTVGIGSAPNSHFMRGAASAGRGTFTHIGELAEVEAEMRRLLHKLKHPVLTDLAVTVDGEAPAEAFPWPLPDLYAGEPVALALRLPDGVSRIEVSGRHGDTPWRQEIALADAEAGQGLARLWARERIAALEAARLTGMPGESVDQAVLKTALDYGLVSRLTSLVAIDVTPARPDGTDVHSRNVPLDLPAGWNWDKVFGEPMAPPQRKAMRATYRVQLAATKAALVDAEPKPAAAPTAPGQQAIALPRTATPAQLHQLAALAALLLAFGVWRWGRQRWTQP
ncbi:MAG: marine proteobacterial sortase target protein [Alphaproteobacteria bacterium]